MLENLTPDFWVNLSATIFFAATVGLMLWDIHNQKKAQRQDAYEALRDDHAEIVKLQLEQDEDLGEIWKKYKDSQPTNVDETKWTKSKNKERKVFLFYVLIFDLYERIHWEIIKEEILDTKKQREDEWEYWLEWLTRISNHWLFEYTFYDVFPVYEDEFVLSITERFFPQKVEKLKEYWNVKKGEEKMQQRRENLKTYQHAEDEKLKKEIKTLQEKAKLLQNELKTENSSEL